MKAQVFLDTLHQNTNLVNCILKTFLPDIKLTWCLILMETHSDLSYLELFESWLLDQSLEDQNQAISFGKTLLKEQKLLLKNSELRYKENMFQAISSQLQTYSHFMRSHCLSCFSSLIWLIFQRSMIGTTLCLNLITFILNLKITSCLFNHQLEINFLKNLKKKCSNFITHLFLNHQQQ